MENKTGYSIRTYPAKYDLQCPICNSMLKIGHDTKAEMIFGATNKVTCCNCHETFEAKIDFELTDLYFSTKEIEIKKEE